MAKKKPNYLSAAEIEAEGNYNMVGDGIINNTQKPSMLEHLKALEERKRERHDEAITENRRELHRADFLDSRDESDR